MPNKNAIVDFIGKWEKMVTNVAKNAETLPPLVQAYAAPLGEVLGTAKALEAMKDTRKAIKQQEVKDHAELMKRGRVLAEILGNALKAHLGPTSEFLVEYGLKPRRPREKKKEPETPQAAGAAAQKAEEPKPENPASAPKPAS